eukprot:2438010-Rhodomonas_salina.1
MNPQYPGTRASKPPTHRVFLRLDHYTDYTRLYRDASRSAVQTGVPVQNLVYKPCGCSHSQAALGQRGRAVKAMDC